MKLAHSFFRRADVTRVARELLGKRLCTRIDGARCAVVITETEAYAGEGDRASHAYGGRRTARTEPMYADGGIAYVYLCYGLHHLFNVVTNVAGVPHAVLVRAGVPCTGKVTIAARRGRTEAVIDGPGKLAQALGITTALSGASLSGRTVWLEDPGLAVRPKHVTRGPRVGVDYAGADARLPYRYVLDASALAPRLSRRDAP